MCYIIWFGTLPLLFYSAHLPSEILHATWQANMSVVLLGVFQVRWLMYFGAMYLKICR